MGAGARIGFHAAHVTEGGRTTETGSGNALLGAYLNKLGLPDRAVLFITQASPDSMSWLTLEAAAREGIDVSPFDLPEQQPAAAAELDSKPARDLFGAVTGPSIGSPRPIGFFAKGCLAGAVSLPLDGDDWQVMRLSRNRNWGMPVLVKTIEHLAHDAHRAGWPGLLIGDMSQPRGGPMKTGHASHQIGLEADIWLTPMPTRTLSRAEREEMAAVNVVAPDRLGVDHSVWTSAHMALVKAAALQPETTRIFVNAAIKKELCRTATGDRSWMTKVRPYWGHGDLINIRLACPDGASSCEEQDSPPEGDGCAEKDLAYWFQPGVLHPTPGKPKPPLPLSALPEACRALLMER